MQGLTDAEVIESRNKYGTNTINKSKNNSFIKQYIASLGDPIIRILLIALGIKTVFLLKQFDWYETIGIVIAIFLASFISTISEYGSEKAFKKLQEEASKIKCKVKRNNKIIEINAEEIVINDLVIIETGDKIPADGIIIQGSITVDESMLTGETKEKYKEKNDIVYKGTVVYSKKCYVKITKIGNDTFYGSIAKELEESVPDSPLKIRLRELAKIISYIGYIGAFLVFLSYLFSNIIIKNNFDLNLIKETITNLPLMSNYILYALTLCVTIIVVSVPEGLPMMITLVLSSNMKRMLKENVLVRKLMGIETAGNLNILFTDKTGTITKGKLEVISFMDCNLKYYNDFNKINPSIKDLVRISLTCNNDSYFESDNIIGSNITDRALLKFVGSKENIETFDIVPFDSKNKYSKVSINYLNKKIDLYKGAYEVLINKINNIYNNGNKEIFKNRFKINEEIKKITKKGIRVICLIIDDTLLGFILIKDEIRSDAIEGIEIVKKAGIKIVMLTGDNYDTALNIAKEAKIFEENDLILTSEELNKMSDYEIKQKLSKLKVVARAIPQDKSRLVRICQENDLVVGMTGDGVNDAPALKKADVGFSMGSGAEVAKEASDIVILDDNFLSIAKAILFGRTIFKSIRKFIIFQLTVNFCAISLSIVGPFIGIETPITVIQMLWVNMIMDTLAALAFAFEYPLKEYMEELPKKKNEPIINRYMKDEIIFTGFYSSLLCFIFLKLPFFNNFFREEKYMMTAFFGLFIFMGIFNCFNARTHRLNLLAHLFKNKIFILIILFVIVVQILLIYFGGELFRTFGLSVKEFVFMVLLSMTVIPIDWIRKCILRYKGIIGGC